MAADVNADVQARKRVFVEALYWKYSQALGRFLARQHLSRDEVADIVQETYCRVHRLPNVEAIEFPQAFLFRVAGNLARNTRKHRRVIFNQGTVDAGSIELAADEPSSFRLLNGEQELAIVRAAFAELSPKCRQVFIMHRFDALSYPQVARELNVSVSMIEKYVSQALAHLRTRLADVSATPKALRLLK